MLQPYFYSIAPFFKKLRHISLLAQLTYALAMLLRSGIDLREAMQYACSLLPNCEIIDKLQACVQGMNEGASFCRCDSQRTVI